MRTIKGRKKEKYVNFCYVLCEEQQQEQINENLEESNCHSVEFLLAKHFDLFFGSSMSCVMF